MDSDSSTDFIDSDENNHCHIGTQKGRKNIRHLKKIEDLDTRTRLSNIKEDERIRRVCDLKKKLESHIGEDKHENELILDYDFVKDCPSISVEKTLVTKLKDHQKEGVKFMWDACYESVEQIEKTEGSGCILAHCMGLGKTLQVVTLVHTLLTNKQTKTNTVLICCPKNTLLNWINEFTMWITPDMDRINIYNPTKFEDHESRSLELTMWQLSGGVCVMNYELYRILLEDGDKSTRKLSLKLREKYHECLLTPGPDLIVCDEGHILKNEDTKLSKIISQIRTMRRIVLTGTPMQNNLLEYHCMIQFVKPFLLGTRTEFLNMFVNPISNGQYENSLDGDVKLMKERSHILHKKLVGCVQRFDLSVLEKFLPEKQEYVISVPLIDFQIDMYRFYLKNYSARANSNWKNQAAFLFADYQALQRVWTHPYLLKLYEDKYVELSRRESKVTNKKKKRRKKQNDENSDPEDESDGESFHWSRYPLSWWDQFVSIDSLEDARQGNKLVLFLKILQECEDAGEKLLLFTVSLFSLRTIEHFLKNIGRSECEKPELCNMTSTWEENEDYAVLTGQTSSKDRDDLCKRFNNANNSRLRLFLISTKAGGMGINLTAASRAILFDVSWNPSHDTQSTFRIYRMGQTKPCFIYRFVASGTMEEKMYGRQVAKQSISHRVVDELETARHFTRTELAALYKLDPYKKKAFDVADIRDPILKSVLNDLPDIVQSVHEHNSLLQHKEDEELEEMEKNNAWTAFKNENSNFIPENVREMLETLKPDDFDPQYLKLILKHKYPDHFEKEITKYMDDIMPRIRKILDAPDFNERMHLQALLIYSDHSHEQIKHSKMIFKDKVKKRKKKSNSTNDKSVIVLNESDGEIEIMAESVAQQKKPEVIDLCSTDSDNSVFKPESLKRSRKRRRTLKPLKSWGTRNGKAYGIPDID